MKKKPVKAVKRSGKTSEPVKDGSFKIEYVLFFLFIIFISLISNSKLSGEDDLYWYLSTGRYIANTWHFPSTDIFAFSTFGQPWIPFEWGWDVIYYFVYKFYGFPGIYILSTIIILLIYYYLFKIMEKFKIPSSYSIIVLFVMTFGVLPRLTVKPHLVTYLFLVLLLTVIIEYKYFNRAKYKLLYYIPLIFLFWVNMHMGVISGFIFLGLYVLYEAVIYLFFRNKEAFRPLDKKDLYRLILVGTASALVTLINPHGWNTFLYAQHIVSMQQLSIIYEWVSPFHTINQGHLFIYVYYFFLLCSLIVLYYSVRQKDYFPILLVIGFIIHSMRAVRLTVDYILISVSFIALASWWLISGAGYGKAFRSKKLYIALSVIILILLINIPFNNVYRTIGSNRTFGIGLDSAHFPVKVFDFMKKSNVMKNVSKPFNNYENGGYFAWNFPYEQAFIGSRGINDNVWNEYVALINSAPGFEEIIKKYNFDCAVWSVPYLNFYDNPELFEYGLIGYLSRQNDWHILYWDDNSVFFIKELDSTIRSIMDHKYYHVNPYKFYYDKEIMDKAAILDSQLFKKEIDRKLREEPDGRIINAIKEKYYHLVNK